MASNEGAAAAAEHEIEVVIEDEAELTAKELAQERKAAVEEHKRKAWLTDTPAQLARRIPVSVFAIANHLAGA